jgi:hypothetical protein
MFNFAWDNDAGCYFVVYAPTHACIRRMLFVRCKLTTLHGDTRRTASFRLTGKAAHARLERLRQENAARKAISGR